MRTIFAIVIILISINFGSCTKATKACFTTSIQDYFTHTIRFDGSCSQSASLFEWNFGDNSAVETTSNEFILHSFNEGGDYTVTLKVTRKDGFTLGKDVYETSQIVHVP